MSDESSGEERARELAAKYFPPAIVESVETQMGRGPLRTTVTAVNVGQDLNDGPRKQCVKAMLAYEYRAMEDLLPLVDQLEAARTRWHEYFGVPISREHAQFMDAIGELAAAIRERLKP